jgi:hypothetical protein
MMMGRNGEGWRESCRKRFSEMGGMEGGGEWNRKSESGGECGIESLRAVESVE